MKGLVALCDELSREEDPLYVRLELKYGVLGFVPPEWFAGRRILDFGSGCGSSTIVLSELLPDSHIVGIEIEQEFVDLARERTAFRKLDVQYFLSPSPQRVSAGLGPFDGIVFSAVYEHLLPAERAPLLQLLWANLRPGGYLFVNQLPHRWFPYEHHTSHLWAVNYLPRPLAGPIVRRFWRAQLQSCDWDALLRLGLRGGTPGEILRRLRSFDDGKPSMVMPAMPGMKDHSDLWLAYTSEKASNAKKRVARWGFKAIERLSGQPFNQSVMVAYRKNA